MLPFSLIGSVEQLRLEPDGLLIVRIEREASAEELAGLARILDQFPWPAGRKPGATLILPPSYSLATIPLETARATLERLVAAAAGPPEIAEPDPR